MGANNATVLCALARPPPLFSAQHFTFNFIYTAVKLAKTCPLIFSCVLLRFGGFSLDCQDHLRCEGEEMMEAYHSTTRYSKVEEGKRRWRAEQRGKRERSGHAATPRACRAPASFAAHTKPHTSTHNTHHISTKINMKKKKRNFFVERNLDDKGREG